MTITSQSVVFLFLYPFDAYLLSVVSETSKGESFFFIMLYKVVLTFKFVDETLVYDHSNES